MSPNSTPPEPKDGHSSERSGHSQPAVSTRPPLLRGESVASKGAANPAARSRSLSSNKPPSWIAGRVNQTLARRAEFMVILIYSLVVMGSAIPFFAGISNTPVVLYYLFVPGYCLTWFFKETYPIVERVLFSGLISITLLLTFFSMRQTVLIGVHLPYDVLVPIFTLIVLLYHYYHA